MKRNDPADQPAARRVSGLVAPPILREGAAFDGAEILRESPGAKSALLWVTYRDIVLWASSSLEQRQLLYPVNGERERNEEIAAAETDERLWAPLFVVARMLHDPVRPDRSRIIYACERIVRWSEANGRPAAALAFAQAAALVAPENPRLAYRVGRLAREVAQYARAETWYRRAIRLGRAHDWRHYILAYLGLGTLYVQVGNHPAARVVTTRALRSAHRRRLREFEGMAHHQLFVIAMHQGAVKSAVEHASVALEYYGDAHPRVPALAHDVAHSWTERGEFQRAHIVQEALLGHITHPPHRVVALANTARAAAGAGQRERYEELRREILPALDACSGDTYTAAAFLSLAHGGVHLGDWTHAEGDATQSIAVASRRGQAEILLEAEAVRDAARDGRQSATRIMHGTWRGTPDPQASGLADALVRALTRFVSSAAG